MFPTSKMFKIVVISIPKCLVKEQQRPIVCNIVLSIIEHRRPKYRLRLRLRHCLFGYIDYTENTYTEICLGDPMKCQ